MAAFGALTAEERAAGARAAARFVNRRMADPVSFPAASQRGFHIESSCSYAVHLDCLSLCQTKDAPEHFPWIDSRLL